MNGVTAVEASKQGKARDLTERELIRALRAKPQRMLDIGHSRVAYWRFGQGPDLFFIHGWPLDAATFRRIVPSLAQSYTCHLIDLPGVGQSESDADAPIDVVSHAQSVRAAIDVLGLDRYALLAHDSGAFVARLVAADNPRVSALVMGNTEIPGHTPKLILAFMLLARMPFSAAVLRTVLANRTLRRSALGFGGCFENNDYIDGDFYDLYVAPLLASSRAAKRQMRLLETLGPSMMTELGKAHPKIRVPVHMIWGTADPFFPVAKARKMIDQFGGPASFEEIRGAKVFPHEDQAEAFATMAKSFLDRTIR